MTAIFMIPATFTPQIFVVCQVLDFVMGTQKKNAEFIFSWISKSEKHRDDGSKCHARGDAQNMLIDWGLVANQLVSCHFK